MGSVSMIGRTAIFKVLAATTSVGLTVAACGAQAARSMMLSRMIAMFRFIGGRFLSQGFIVFYGAQSYQPVKIIRFFMPILTIFVTIYRLGN
jgi:hypothetical protein